MHDGVAIYDSNKLTIHDSNKLTIYISSIFPDELNEDEIKEEDEKEDVKPASLWVRVCCCGCFRNVKTLKNIEKSFGDALITVIEALV